MWRQTQCSSVWTRLAAHRRHAALLFCRSYTRSAIVLEENVAASTSAAKIDKKEAARLYAERRNVYRKHVSELRKQYAAEVAAQRAADQAEKAAKQKKEIREKLERQRLKNIRSAQSALRQKEKQARRNQEFQEELRVAQANRDARNSRFAKARQLVIDELEEEAHLWLTTPEEVEKAFAPEAEQLLWARPNSVLGAPTPTEDAEYWRFETHTWHMDKTYPTPRELLLEDLEELAYKESNIDSLFWTPERLAQRKELEDKAKLRAMVYDAGKRALLQKQKDMLQGRFAEMEESGIPQPVPVPSVSILANRRAMEKEGVEILRKDPTKFFEFEGSSADDHEESESTTYSGPTLGVPIGLKDPLRYGTPQNRPFPLTIGQMPKPDLRTEREKKRQEREERMLAAARAAAGEGKDDADVDIAGEDSLDVGGETIDYENIEYDSDDEVWEKGLDPEADADIINMPREHRYKEEDVDWVMEQLERKVQQLEEQLQFEVENTRQELRAKRESGEKESKIDAGLQVSETESENDERLRELGVDVDQLDTVMSSLTEEQILALLNLDELDVETMSPEEISEKLQNVPNLTDDQIEAMLIMERSLSENEKVRNAFGDRRKD